MHGFFIGTIKCFRDANAKFGGFCSHWWRGGGSGRGVEVVVVAVEEEKEKWQLSGWGKVEWGFWE